MSIKSSWEWFGDALGATPIHPQFFAKRYATKARAIAIDRSFGVVADVGSGRAPYRHAIEAKSNVTKYITIDHPEATEFYDKDYPLDIKADISETIPMADKSVDTAVLLMVMEHLPQPSAALAELYRILKPGGVIILSTVMTHPVHDAPFDFYRYTRFGIERLLKDNGLSIIQQGWEGAFIATAVTVINTSIFQQLKAITRTKWLMPVGLLIGIVVWPMTIILNLLALIVSPFDGLHQLPHTVWAVAKRPGKN